MACCQRIWRNTNKPYERAFSTQLNSVATQKISTRRRTSDTRFPRIASQSFRSFPSPDLLFTYPRFRRVVLESRRTQERGWEIYIYSREVRGFFRDIPEVGIMQSSEREVVQWVRMGGGFGIIRDMARWSEGGCAV